MIDNHSYEYVPNYVTNIVIAKTVYHKTVFICVTRTPIFTRTDK